jgi:hypothetical protein
MPSSQISRALSKHPKAVDKSPHVCQHVKHGACTRCRFPTHPVYIKDTPKYTGPVRTVRFFEPRLHAKGGRRMRKVFRCIRLTRLGIGNEYKGHWYGPPRLA